jgi:glutaconate CoA-transferase subunit A
MNVMESGVGPVFSDPDPDAARAFFRKKKRTKTNKVMTLKKAVETFVHDGDYLAIGGFGANRTPIAACHEIVRQGRKNMGFAGHTATHDMQILSAGEVYDRLDVAYVVGLEARGLSACSRNYLQSGKVKITEWTNYALSLRLKAAAMGVPFLPARNMMGTDTFRYSGAKIIECPYTGKKLVALPALYPDISFIHVHESDVYGNCRFRGIAVADLELAGASKRLVITTERLVQTEEIQRDPTATRIPYHLVDAVCVVPYGAYPGTMSYEYFSDEAHIKEWLTAEKDAGTFKAFLDENIYLCKDHEAYLMKNGGLSNMDKLRELEFMISREEK